MKHDAIFVDLDGTMLESAGDLQLAVNIVMQKLQLPERPLEEVKKWVGNGTVKLVARAITGTLEGSDDDELVASMMPLFDQAYEEALCKASFPFPGVEESLSLFQQKGIPLACITNKPRGFSETLLENFGLLKYFNTVIGGDSTAHRKPHPAPLLKAAEECGIEVKNALMIGDSRHDVEAARNAGCSVVCVTYGYNHGEDIRLAEPDGVVGSFTEIPQVLGLSFSC